MQYDISPGSDLSGANLSGYDLRNADLFGANLEGADLRGTDLRGADLRTAKIKGAKTKGIKLAGAKLPHDDIRTTEGTVSVWRHHVTPSTAECEVWRGATNNNHNTTGGKSYDYGVFQLEGCKTDLVHRQVFFIHTGEELGRDLEVTPYCGDHLCVNPKHLGVVPASVKKDRKKLAVPMIDFF